MVTDCGVLSSLRDCEFAQNGLIHYILSLSDSCSLFFGPTARLEYQHDEENLNLTYSVLTGV